MMESSFKDKLEAAKIILLNVAKKMQWAFKQSYVVCVQLMCNQYNIKSVDYDRFQSCSSH